MRKFLSVAALAAICLSTPSYSQEIGATTNLMLRCGAAYMLLSDDKEFAETEEDKKTYNDFGELLVTMADEELFEAGFSTKEREDLSFNIAREVDETLEADLDPGFTLDDCLSLVEEKTAENDEIDVLMRCGASYLLLADKQDAKEDQEMLENFGMTLLNRADEALAAKGMSEAERTDIGKDITSEANEFIERDELPGVTSEQCLAMLGFDDAAATDDKEEAAAAPAAEVATADAERDKKIDMLMTCGAGFLASAKALEATEKSDATMLEHLGTAQINAAEELMIESGMGEGARFQVSQLYGEQVGTKVAAGEDLAYDWDTCARLDY